MIAALGHDVMIDPSLRLYIPFNESVGDVAKDYSQYGNNGVFTDVKWGTNGGLFNGTSAFVNCGNDPSLNITDAITIEVWVKTTQDTDREAIISKYQDSSNFAFIFYRRTSASNNVLRVQIKLDNVVSNVAGTTPVTKNVWHHVVFTIDASNNAMIYLDGVDDTSGGAVISNRNNLGDLRIGETVDPYWNSIKGTIDEVMIYNRALSADEIKRKFERGKAAHDL